MKLLSTLSCVLLGFISFAQVCTIDYSNTTPGVYPSSLVDAEVGVPYSAELTLVFPENESGVNYSSFKITGIELPLGLTWECSNEVNGCEYNPQQDPYACIFIAGTPAEAGTVTVNINSNSVKSNGDTGVYTEQATLEVLPSTVANTLFSFTPAVGCDNEQVNFSLVNPINYTPIPGQTTGIAHSWDFGNGLTSSSATPPAQTYGVGTHTIEYEQVVDTIGFRLTGVTIHTVGCDDAVGFGNPDIYIQVLNANNTVVYSTNPNDADVPQVYSMNVLLNNPPYKIRVMDDDSDNWWGTADDNCINGAENDAATPISLPAVNSFGATTQSANNQSLSFSYTITKDVIVNTATDEVIIHASPAVPVVTENPGTPTTLSTDDLGYVYHWNQNGNRLYDARGTEITPETTGTYTVIAVDNNGCYAVSEGKDISFVGLAENENSSFNLYPNPATNHFVISFIETINNADVIITDMSGRTVSTLPVSGVNEVVVNTTSLSKGIYNLSVQYDNGSVSSRKLVVQ